MTTPCKSLLPNREDISDGAAAVLTEFLFHLTDHCQSRYGAKIDRHADARQAAKIDELNAPCSCRRGPSA
jgi:hypothetical protein